MDHSLKQRLPKLLIGAVLLLTLVGTGLLTIKVSAATASSNPGSGQTHQCGTGNEAVYTSINIGCKGDACLNPPPTGPPTSYCDKNINPIIDMLFAFIRILSDGVGIVVIGSMIVGGIQFSASRSDPQASAAAITRVRTSVIALIIYIFAYAILNFVIPKGFFS